MKDVVCKAGSWVLALFITPAMIVTIMAILAGLCMLLKTAADASGFVTTDGPPPWLWYVALTLFGVGIFGVLVLWARDYQPDLYAHCRRYWGKSDA